jgi:hypothetical protein
VAQLNAPEQQTLMDMEMLVAHLLRGLELGKMPTRAAGAQQC